MLCARHWSLRTTRHDLDVRRPTCVLCPRMERAFSSRYAVQDFRDKLPALPEDHVVCAYSAYDQVIFPTSVRPPPSCLTPDKPASSLAM